MPKLSEVVGTYRVHPTEAIQMLQAIFEPHDLISLSGKRAGVSRTTVLTQILKQEDLVKQLMSSKGEETLQDLCFNPHEMDIYVGLGAVKKDKQFQPFNRVKEKDISSVRCLYLDVDVKEGAFSSTQEAWDFIWETCIKYKTPPTYITASGSGGLHVYWRVCGGSVIGLPRPYQDITTDIGKDMLEMWWTLFNAEAVSRGKELDRLIDLSRMSRLSGTVHFPKTSENTMAEVRQLYVNKDAEYTVAYITEITKDTYQEYKEKVSGVRKTELKNARDRIKKNRKEALKPPDNLSFTQKMAFLAEQADYYPQKIDELLRWDDILVPHGWRFINEGTEGRRLWSRPGGDYRKSAVTDWEGSEGNVMSLMSTSRETGLLDLLEAHIPLTKERVLLRLSFNDQYELMTDWIDSLIE